MAILASNYGTSIFVFCFFSLICNFKFRIISVQQTLLLVESEDFDFSRHFMDQIALYSLVMTGLVVCCSGIESKQKKTEIHSKIKMMNGKVSQGVDEKVTHLLVNKKVGSEKYYVSVVMQQHVSQKKILIYLIYIFIFCDLIRQQQKLNCQSCCSNGSMPSGRIQMNCLFV